MIEYLLRRRAAMLSIKKEYIIFVDPEVERICMANWSSDGIGVTKANLAAVTDIGTLFRANTTIVSFDEFVYFTSLRTIAGGNTTASGAFYGCTNLESIVFPSSVTNVQGCAFHTTSALAVEVDLPNLTSLGVTAFKSSGITKIKDLGELTTIVDGSGGSIGVFLGCTSLTEVTLPATLTYIGVNAFRGCTSLQSVSVSAPSSLRVIATCAFYGCSNLETFTLPSTITTINANAFYGCTKLEGTIYLPNLTGTLGTAAFHSTKITQVTSLGSITTVGGGSGAAGGAFRNCKSLTSVVLPSTVTTIGQFAFNGCTSLSSMNLPTSITTLGVGCFVNAPIQGEVNLPNLTSFGTQAFQGTRITSVKSLGTITSLPAGSGGTSGCFMNCTSLTSVVLPSTITSIGVNAFRATSSMETFVCLATTPPTLGSNCFYNMKSTSVFYVPNGYGNTYKTASGWSSYASRIYELDANGNIPT